MPVLGVKLTDEYVQLNLLGSPSLISILKTMFFPMIIPGLLYEFFAAILLNTFKKLPDYNPAILPIPR